MTPSQREQADDLFCRLSELAPEQRTQELACVTDLEVRAEVESLLCHTGSRYIAAELVNAKAQIELK